MSVCVYVCIVHMFGFEILYYGCNSNVFNGKFKYVFNNSILKTTKYSWYFCRGLCTCDL